MNMSNEQFMRETLPNFYQMCEDSEKGTDIIMSQAVFEDDTRLMGYAIEYARSKGLNMVMVEKDDKEARIIPMFVFGTLRNQSTREMLEVFPTPTEIQEATLEGYRKENLNIIEDTESNVPGDYFMVTKDELKRLDRYEGCDRDFYHRFLTNVLVDGKEKRAYAYQIIGT